MQMSGEIENSGVGPKAALRQFSPLLLGDPEAGGKLHGSLAFPSLLNGSGAGGSISR